MATSFKIKEDLEASKEPKVDDPLQGDGALGDSNLAYNHHVVIPKTISAKLKEFSPFWKAAITLLVLVAVFGLIIAILLRPVEDSNLVTFPNVSYPNVAQCGLRDLISRDAGRHRRIVNGVRTREGEWPWTVFISPSSRSYNALGICGGILINENWVLTAAHCLYQTNYQTDYWIRHDINGFELLMGSLMKNDSELTNDNIQKRTLEKIYVHPKYFAERKIHNYDFAMLKVKEPFNISGYVSPVCIAQPDMNFPAGTECVVAGWGSMSQSPDLPLMQLNTRIPLVSYDDCIRFTKTLTNRLVPYVTKEKVCAGYFPEEGRHRTGACQGDSGSGLVCPGDDGRWYAVGLVSLGKKCGEISYYTKLSKMTDFVAEVLSDNPPPDDLKCPGNGDGIWPEQICDGRNDCGDFSDEQDCECSERQFRCDNGLCKLEYFEYCNSINECGDGSDERNCIYFECDNGSRVSTNFVCDGDFDCLDRTDEGLHCECGTGQFRCNNSLCRPLSWKCDGDDDCGDGSDEFNCECTESSFRCNNSRCVPPQNVCDLMDNCGDFSDEDYCNCMPGLTIACEIEDLRLCASEEWKKLCKRSFKLGMP